MEIKYCWRCKANIPFLNESEWAEIEPLLVSQAEILKRYRSEYNCDLKTASENAFKPATEKYFELTGYFEPNYVSILHHRLSLYGPECATCGVLLRTPKAKLCANCGKAKV